MNCSLQEDQPQKTAFFRRKWRAVKRILTGSNRGSYRFDHPPSSFEPDPSCPRLVSFRKLDDTQPGPTTKSHLAEMDPAKNKPVVHERANPQPPPVTADTGIAGKPFRATQVWNSVVDNLQTQVKVKKRRHNLKIYQDCFSGSEAVDVVLAHIIQSKVCKDAEVPRSKAVRLCQHLNDANVFEEVDTNVFRKNKSHAKFKDSSYSLYRFLPTTGTSSTPWIRHIIPRDHREKF
ncbi:DEP domain-containing protein 7-like [Triplophysa dalaica]|uniref:DEP domain-containing protein 7-like n=1 Tax=Triplophysa dalaica TaxID=1582913 RepID=UPI0024DFE0A5|nr:DEP domain-containing protein 7-like [Triplophysa dalaica]XP_056592637.1 DEP domain-containing protein 7-like [Triplophysa dalaica]